MINRGNSPLEKPDVRVLLLSGRKSAETRTGERGQSETVESFLIDITEQTGIWQNWNESVGWWVKFVRGVRSIGAASQLVRGKGKVGKVKGVRVLYASGGLICAAHLSQRGDKLRDS